MFFTDSEMISEQCGLRWGELYILSCPSLSLTISAKSCTGPTASLRTSWIVFKVCQPAVNMRPKKNKPEDLQDEVVVAVVVVVVEIFLVVRFRVMGP